MDPAQLAGPGHLRMKIRVDIDAFARTNKIRNRFWDPARLLTP